MNKVFALMLVKNEEDIIGYNIEYLQTQDIDHIIIADNLSTDKTPLILEELAKKFGNITIIKDTNPAHIQGKKTTKMMHMAAEMGATHICPIDADEIWFSNDPQRTLGEMVKSSDNVIFDVKPIEVRPQKELEEGENPLEVMNHFVFNCGTGHNIAFSYHKNCFIGDGNHSVINHPGKKVAGKISFLHYPYRSVKQIISKFKKGKESLEKAGYSKAIGAHWHNYGAMSDEKLRDIFYNKFLFEATDENDIRKFNIKNYSI